MARPFTVTRSVDSDIAVLHLEGFLDAYTAPALETAIQHELDEGRARIIVDSAKLTYISSAGLGVFMGYIEDIRRRGGDLKLCGLSTKVRQIFEIVGFHTIYDMVPDVASAVRRFAEAPTRTL